MTVLAGCPRWDGIYAEERERTDSGLHSSQPNKRLASRIAHVFLNDRLWASSTRHSIDCLCGQRPSSPAAATSPARLHLSLLRDLQGVVDFDPEVSDRAFEFAVTEQKLDPEDSWCADRSTSVWCGVVNGCRRPPGPTQLTREDENRTATGSLCRRAARFLVET